MLLIGSVPAPRMLNCRLRVHVLPTDDVTLVQSLAVDKHNTPIQWLSLEILARPFLIASFGLSNNLPAVWTNSVLFSLI